MNRLFLVSLLAVAANAGAATTLTVNWSAAFDNGFALADGTALATGNEVRLGSFNISDAQVAQLVSIGDLPTLGSHFISFGSAAIGDANTGSPLSGVPFANRGGLFEKSTTTSMPITLASQGIYFWVFKTAGNNAVSGNYSNVTQTGIFSNNTAAWDFPGDTGQPESRTVDLTNLSDGPGTNLSGTQNIVVGGFGTGTTPATGTTAFNLATVTVIPEPSVALMALGSLGLLAARRRRNA